MDESAAHEAGMKLVTADEDTAKKMRTEWEKLFAAKYAAALEALGK